MVRRKRKTSAIRRYHRTFGVAAAVFVLFMVLSGITLNHSNGLGLDRQHVSQTALLSWYGINEPEHLYSFAVDDDWLSFAGQQLYLNDRNVLTLPNGVGAVSTGNMLIAAGKEEIVLLDSDGRLIERLHWDQPGSGPIRALGLLENHTVVVKSDHQIWLADTRLLDWQPSGRMVETPVWSSPSSLPETLYQAIMQKYRGDGISMERLLLDLHSGRIFGPVGLVIYDLLALALGFLAMSGLILWVRGKRKSKRNGKSTSEPGT